MGNKNVTASRKKEETKNICSNGQIGAKWVPEAIKNIKLV